MSAFQSMLVCIEFPDARKQPALRRAVQLARQTGARITLFHSTWSHLEPGLGFGISVVQEETARILAAARSALLRIAARLRKQGLKVDVKVAWDYPACEAIVREAVRSKQDLVVAGSRRHVFGARLFLTNTDWQLIRLCPVPLLFVKQDRSWGRPRILAAIDPLHLHGKPAQLERRILEAASSMRDAHGGRLDVVHAFLPLYSYLPDVPSDAFTAAVDPEVEQRYRQAAKRALQRATARFDLPPERLHLETGQPTAVVTSTARRLRADLVVMGAVSRSALGRVFIGSTAERTLDLLPCDVLVIKPRGFRTPVARRPAVPRQ